MDVFHTARYRDRLTDIIAQIFSIDSPSGYTGAVMRRIEDMARALGYPFQTTNKGCGIITVDGLDNSRAVLLCAHVDTLGAMVRSVTSKGDLKFTSVGGPLLPTLDGEYCRVRTRDGGVFTGTFLSSRPAAHVFPDAKTKARDEENMLVRLDEKVHKKEDVTALGIQPGDYICIDPKTVITESGFLKSRFIDDKGSVACLMTALEILRASGLKPRYRTLFFISAYEECGHGAAYLPQGVSEALAVDMGCVGLDLSCTEYDVSICAKDSDGPYDYEMVSGLIRLARDNGLNYAVDIYPMYGSDVGTAQSAGNDIRGALIGPGVHASHGMERTHLSALENTVNLILLYLGCKNTDTSDRSNMGE